MIFRDPKTGQVSDDINQIKCDSRCDRCPIGRINNGKNMVCTEFANAYPDEAARLMGWEIIREPGIDFPMPEYDPDEVALKPKEKKPFVNHEIEFIREHLDERDILEQLAEEATELAQAALKMIRACGHKNPTPVTPEEAYIDIIKECADISNCLVAMGYNTAQERLLIARTMHEKQVRWVERIQEEEAKRGI